MRLTVVGCSGSFPGPDSAASCYLVQADDADGRTWTLVLDLGNGAFGPLQRWCDPFDIDAVGLSHLHSDHMADVSSLFVYLRYGPAATGSHRRAPVPVHGPFGTASRLAEVQGSEPGESMAAELAVHVWQPGRGVDVGPMRMTPVAVEHPVPAYGVRVTGPSERDPRTPVTLAYTGDTDACPGLDELATGADLLLAEAAFVEGRDEARGVHLTGRRAGQAAENGGSRQLLLTHLPVWTPAEVAAEEARQVYTGPVAVAHTGMSVAL